MKKIYYSPKVKFVEIDLDCVLGNYISNGEPGAPEDVPDPTIPGLGEDDEGMPT